MSFPNLSFEFEPLEVKRLEMNTKKDARDAARFLAD